MARRQRQYTARFTFPIDMEGNDGNTQLVNSQIDLAVAHSERMQRNVRQGQVFHLHSVRAALQPNGGDIDIGLAAACSMRWAPATRNSVKAWQHLFGVWAKQKQLRVGAIGPHVRYDDFELAYDSAYTNSRTSVVYTDGMQDLDSESCVIYGASTSGDDVSLEDIYESLQSQHSPSRFPISNATVKASKYVQQFPDPRIVDFGAHYSTTLPSGNTAGEPDSGATYGSTMVYIKDSACLAGLVVIKANAIPEDIPLFTGDALNLNVEITYSVGSSLVYKPRPKQTTKKMAYKPRSSRKYTKKA